MKLLFLALVLAVGAHAGEFHVKAWKKPPNWKCKRLDQGALTCWSPFADEQAKMIMRLKPAPGETLSSLRPRGRKVHFAKNRDIHGQTWMDALSQPSQGGTLTRSSQTLLTINGKRMAFEVMFEAPEETYESIQSTVNRTISSVRLSR